MSEHVAELPPSVAPYAGRITDVDSHEQIPAQEWTATFGEAMRPFAEVKLAQPHANGNHPNIAGYAGDVMELTRENVWTSKGCTAPGAMDVRRRIDVMDMMQIRRQLMFPTAAGTYGMLVYTAPEGSAMHRVFGDDSQRMARRMIAAGNEWMVAQAKVSDRVRPVATLTGETVEELTGIARDLLRGGIRAFVIAAGRLPGGVSPADEALDRFYAMLSEAKAALTVHVGGEAMLFRSTGWNEAKPFEQFKVSEEMSGDPLRLTTFHFAAQNFISAMILGGVFDRHPGLRFGIVEYGAHFIGPLSHAMDMWYDMARSTDVFMPGQHGYKLKLRPSEYLSRNVRVSPFDFEPLGDYIEKYGLEDVYAFASDYPHVEGGKNPIQRLSDNLREHGHGSSVFEKFFVTNGEWLLPD